MKGRITVTLTGEAALKLQELEERGIKASRAVSAALTAYDPDSDSKPAIDPLKALADSLLRLAEILRPMAQPAPAAAPSPVFEPVRAAFPIRRGLFEGPPWYYECDIRLALKVEVDLIEAAGLDDDDVWLDSMNLSLVSEVGLGEIKAWAMRNGVPTDRLEECLKL